MIGIPINRKRMMTMIIMTQMYIYLFHALLDSVEEEGEEEVEGVVLATGYDKELDGAYFSTIISSFVVIDILFGIVSLFL